jgi:hypothetical protein
MKKKQITHSVDRNVLLDQARHLESMIERGELKEVEGSGLEGVLKFLSTVHNSLSEHEFVVLKEVEPINV